MVSTRLGHLQDLLEFKEAPREQNYAGDAGNL